MPYRNLCEVLDEMRKCFETRNFSYLAGLVEEVQTMGNRMEAALWDQNDYRRAKKELVKVENAIETHQSKCKAAKEELCHIKAEVKTLKREKHQLLVEIHQDGHR